MGNYRERIYASYGRNFQDAPTVFDRAAARRWGRGCRHHLRRWLPEDTTACVVDVACGGGRLLQLFVDQGYRQVEGCDLSPDQVALSRQVVPAVTQGDVLGFLESHPGRFDLITAFDLIEHLHKDEVLRFLDAARLALKPAGRLILQTPNADGPWGASHRYNDFTHEVGFNPNSLGRLLRLTGFDQVEARECGPVPFGHSLFASIRSGLWQLLRLHLLLWNLIETGSAGSRVLTRVFLISGIRRD